MLIKETGPIEALDPDRSNQDVVDDQAVIKKEPVESTEEIPKSTDDENSKPIQLSNTLCDPSPATASPSTMGKRKRKPKLVEDEIYEITMTKMKKKRISYVSKSNHATLDITGRRVRKEKASIDGFNSPGQVKSPTMIRAEEIQTSLGTEFPSFVKPLVRSHVSSCFWMGLPLPFSKMHLPCIDSTFVLEDESGEQYKLKYIGDKPGLSAGWRKFAMGHNLLEGDVLIFRLVESNKFKVYIVRANETTEVVDSALTLLNLDAPTKQNGSDSPNLDVDLQNNEIPEVAEQSRSESEEIHSEVLEDSRSSDQSLRTKDMKGFNKFHIIVNGSCINSELPKHIRMKYYDLCCSKNTYLHKNLMNGFYTKLVSGIIFETVRIADAIRGCKITTSRDEFAVWDKSLKSFEILGMNVGFLRARLRQLLGLAFEANGASETKRYLEAKAEQRRTEEKIRELEIKMGELKEVSKKVAADIEMLKPKAEGYELKFQEEADAPW